MQPTGERPTGERPMVIIGQDAGMQEVGTDALYQRIATRFGDLLAHCPADRWSSPSPCDGWTAWDVAAHVIRKLADPRAGLMLADPRVELVLADPRAGLVLAGPRARLRLANLQAGLVQADRVAVAGLQIREC